jgi:hypothetical protein
MNINKCLQAGLDAIWPKGTCATMGFPLDQYNISMGTMLSGMINASNTAAVAASLNNALRGAFGGSSGGGSGGAQGGLGAVSGVPSSLGRGAACGHWVCL